MVDAMGFVREEVFVADALKCFPKERVPSAEEYEACRAYLCQQIDFIQPKVVVAMGAFALKSLMGKTAGIVRLRGEWQNYQGIKLMPTFHPLHLLRDPSKKKLVWQDLKLVLKELGRVPKKN